MKKVKKIIAAVSAAAISASLIGAVPVFAADYTVSFGSTQEFNRVQLVWDEVQSGAVSVKVGDKTLTGTADGTVLNLYEDSIKTEKKSNNQDYQVFERISFDGNSIKVSAANKPSAVRLYKDDLISAKTTQDGFTQAEKNLYDGDLITYGIFYTAKGAAPIPSCSITKTLTDVYDVSEFLLYTGGMYSWYPKSYSISYGTSNVNGVPVGNGESKSTVGCVTQTPMYAKSDSFTVTFTEGGYVEADNYQQYNAFRVYEVELYGSKAPVWASTGMYTLDFDEEKTFNRIQLTWDEAQTGTVMASIGGKFLSGTVNNGTTLNLFESTVTTSETEKGTSGGYKQSFDRKSLSADSITVFSDKMPASVSLYLDDKIGFKNTDIDNDSVTGFNETGNSINRELLRDGNYDAYGTSIGQNSTVKDGSFTVKLDKAYNVSEFILYTYGPYGWYPKEYTINGTEGTKGQEPDLINQSVLEKRSPWYHPYILTTPLTETSEQTFTVAFKDGGYSFDQKTSQYTGGFRIQEIEFYGSDEAVFTGSFTEKKVDTATWVGKFEGSDGSQATAYSAEFELESEKTYKSPTVKWEVDDKVGKTLRISPEYDDVSGVSSAKYGLVLNGAYFDENDADVTATFTAGTQN